MKGTEVFPSRFLKAEELDHDVVLNIDRVKLETLKDQSGADVQKPVCYFKGHTKGLVLNKTNWASIAKITGSDDSDEWTGKQITLTVIDVDAFGDVVSAIRVKTPRANKGAKPAAPLPKQADNTDPKNLVDESAADSKADEVESEDVPF